MTNSKKSTKTVAASTKTTTVELKGNILKMYNMLKSGKGITHAGVMAFKKANGLASAYQILFRLRRIGLKTKQFTITAVGDTKPTRTYKMVKGVTKGTSATWPKALPIRSKTNKKSTAKKTTAANKPAAKKAPAKPVAKKQSTKPVVKAVKAVKQPVLVGADDDAIVAE